VSFRCGVLTAVFNFGCASANCIGGEFAGASFYYQVYGLSLTDCEWDLDLPFVGSIITVDAGTPIWTCGAPSGSVHITSSASSC
jgi:hypothetical protein